MKTLLVCLLIAGSTVGGKPKINCPRPGGINILIVEPAKSSLGWKVEKTTGAHSGSLKVSSGRLVFCCGHLVKGTIVFDMNTILVADLSGERRQQLENNLKGDNFFDTGKFPLGRLEIISVDHQSEARYHFITITAELVFHGITKTVIFTAEVTENTGQDFIARADIVLDRRDWKIATKDIKYDTFINKDIHLLATVEASGATQQISSL